MIVPLHLGYTLSICPIHSEVWLFFFLFGFITIRFLRRSPAYFKIQYLHGQRYLTSGMVQ